MNERLRAAAAVAHELPLGACVLDIALGELRGLDRLPVPLRPQALELLLMLGRRHGQVVTKDELMQQLWGDAEVGETSLSQAVVDARRALGDSGHRLLRNVARRGYLLAVSPDVREAPPLSIAVLPIDIEGNAQGLDWLADALHGDLIAELAGLPGSLLIASETMRSFRQRPLDARQVARELCVRHIVRVGLRPLGEQLQLNIELIDGHSGELRHAERVIGERASLPANLLMLAVRIERQLSRAVIQTTVLQRSQLAPAEVQADDLAMRVVALSQRQVSADSMAQMERMLEQAIAMDPDCVRAWGMLAFVLVHQRLNGWAADADAAATTRRIEAIVARMDQLAPDGPMAHQARMILAHERRDWVAFLALARNAAAQHLRPGPHAGYGWALVLHGRPDEALVPLETAVRLSPRDAMRAEWQYRLAWAHFMAGRDDLACEWAETAALSNPELAWPPLLAAALARQGQWQPAREAKAAHCRRHPGWQRALERRLPAASPAMQKAREALLAAVATLD